MKQYDEEYDLFLKFFKIDIVDKLTDIQKHVREDKLIIENLKHEMVLLSNDIEEKLNLLNNFKCPICNKQFKRQTFLERHITKLHNINIPQVDGLGDTFNDSISLMFEQYEIEAENSYPFAKCIECNIAFENEDRIEEHEIGVHVDVSFTWWYCAIWNFLNNS